jgi:serine/threonine protein kinase
LGQYEVLSHIGSGGMGEVYQANDTKLGRDVAIKVLPDNFARDPERLARFKREAKLLASLNHPNIAAIYGLEESDGIHFLVLELVPGETLAERVAAGALPVREAVTISQQVADALEHAHEKNVIHRDLKPANVKLTPEGKVKVLDFGLAKAFASEGQPQLDSNASTLSSLPTQEGRILGTPAYMSPEQAQGKTVDKRTDIWSFGCLLYELLTARRAFPGENVTQTIAAVLRADPDWQALPAQTPERVREILERCLEKGLGGRRRDIGDVRLELEKELHGTPKTEPVTAVALRMSWRHKMLWGAASLALLVIAIAAVWYIKPTPTPAQPVMRLNMNVSPADQLTGYN